MRCNKTFLLLFSLVSLVLHSKAQPYVFRMGNAFNQIKQPTYGSLYVIDVRENKEIIGELKTGAFNRTRPIITEKSLSDLLSLHYDRLVADSANVNPSLLFVVYKFEIEDRANGGEVGTFYIDVDVFGENSGKYAFLSRVDSIYEVTSGWDVTQALLKATQDHLIAFLTRQGSQKLLPPSSYILTRQQAVDRRNDMRRQYPIFQTTEFKKGICYTVDQFLNNAPVDTPFLKTVVQPTGGKKQLYFYYPNAKGKKGKPIDAKSYFAIFDGKDWAVSSHSHAETLRFQSGDFYAHLPFRGIGDKSGATSAGIMFGGVIGGAIAGAAYGNDKVVWGIYKAKFDRETKTFVPQKRLY